MQRRLLAGALSSALVISTVLTTVAAGTAAGTDNASKQTAIRAVRWLDTVQRPDGGFELAGFPGFETPDAILAIAERSQADDSWSTAEAFTGVSKVKQGAHTGLDVVDDLADGAFGTLTAGQAAKLIVLVAAPLGLDPGSFDPAADGATDLEATMVAGRQPNGSFGTFNATLYAVTGYKLVGRKVPPATRAFIAAAQQTNGGWDFAGDPGGADIDIDTTGLAVQALIAAGASPGSTAIRNALGFLAHQQQASGAWASFGSEDPNSTSVAVVAVTATGGDVTGPCWRDAAAPDLAGDPYADPAAWLRSQQAPDGHIVSPNDGFGVNTFATSQSVQALLRSWLPVDGATVVPCP
jgi:hypothetical protein